MKDTKSIAAMKYLAKEYFQAEARAEKLMQKKLNENDKNALFVNWLRMNLGLPLVPNTFGFRRSK